MKACKKIIILTVLASLCYPMANAQVINWGNNYPGKHMANLNAGAEYGVVGGAAYACRLDAGPFPVWAGIGLSTPAGEVFLDDYKLKAGGQARLLSRHKFHLGAGIQFLFRTVNTPYIKARNLGGELSVTGGHYTSKWFLAAELGFDKAAATYIKHDDHYKQVYPGVKDGWYEVPTGGNFNFGIQTGVSFGRNDLYLKAGMLRAQDLTSAPLLPMYAQLGYNFKFNSRHRIHKN